VNAIASQLGMVPGLSLDLTTDDVDGVCYHKHPGP